MRGDDVVQVLRLLHLVPQLVPGALEHLEPTPRPEGVVPGALEHLEPITTKICSLPLKLKNMIESKKHAAFLGPSLLSEP